MRLKLLIAYVGTCYSGWQIQEKPSPPPTVQGEMEKALRTITGQNIRAHGSGRTDSGVHAHGQVVHCDVPDARASSRIFLCCVSRWISASKTFRKLKRRCRT